MELKYKIDSPSKLQEEEIQKFYDFVIEGNQVSRNGLKERILNCEKLGFCFDKEKLVGIVALKNPNLGYKNRVFREATIENESENYIYEIGYAFTKNEYRGQGINGKLNEMIVNSVDENVYATTASKGMKRLLERLGFKELGIPYSGTYNEEKLEILGIKKKPACNK